MRTYNMILILVFMLTACQEERNIVLSVKEPVSTETIPLLPEPIALKIHNQLREQHFNNAPLSYSLKIEKDAQGYANYLADNGLFKHDATNYQNKYGENLYAFSSSKKPNPYKIIQKWYDEKIYYNHEKCTCQEGKLCGHYTQIVWKDSKQLGCASAQYKTGRFKNGYVTVCKYYPYGNIIGQDPY